MGQRKGRIVMDLPEEIIFNENGTLYMIFPVLVQRGMGNQKAHEVIIHGVPATQARRILLKYKLGKLTKFIGTKTVIKLKGDK